MTQIGILSGIKSDANAEIFEALPVNLDPSVQETGISKGFLKSSAGITSLSSVTTGRDRAAVNWNDTCYRVQGSKLISVDSAGNVIVIGDVGDDGQPAFMDYGFDRLAISSNGDLFYWNGTTLTQVTDPDLGTCKCVIWIDGYYLCTDGTSIVSTELANPNSVIPTSYGSAETDPDGIQGLQKIRDEAIAVGRYSLEYFTNVGGSGFPFQRNASAYVPKGAIGPKAYCEFNNVLAFVGSGKKESLIVYLCQSGETVAISNDAVSKVLQDLTEDQQKTIQLEKVVIDNKQMLYVHLPTQTLVYHYEVSIAAGLPVWTSKAGGVLAASQYPLRNLIYVYNRYVGGNSVTGQIGYIDPSITTHYGSTVGWNFVTNYVYSDGGFTVTELELVATTGRAPLGVDPTVFMSYSRDGINFSQERAVKQGKVGEYAKRLVWRPMIQANNYMCFKFRGANTAIASITRLEAAIEGNQL